MENSSDSEFNAIKILVWPQINYVDLCCGEVFNFVHLACHVSRPLTVLGARRPQQGNIDNANVSYQTIFAPEP
eukprot:2782324-Amphidinium_carterae.1